MESHLPSPGNERAKNNKNGRHKPQQPWGLHKLLFRQPGHPEMAWWFKDIVLGLILSVLLLALQVIVDDRRQRISERADVLQSIRQAVAGAEGAKSRLLYASDLGGINLSGLDLQDARMPGTDLSEASMDGADLQSVDLVSADLTEATLANATLIGADLRNASLSGANLNRADLGCLSAGLPRKQSNPSGCVQLMAANLSGASLKLANLRGADLWDADLTNTDLSGVHAVDAKLTSVDFRGATLGCVMMTTTVEPKKACADLSESTLWNVDFSGADLSGADLTLTRLNGANLSDARNLDKANLADICYDATTLWPNGFPTPPPRRNFCPTSDILRADVHDLYDQVRAADWPRTIEWLSRDCVDRIDVNQWQQFWSTHLNGIDTSLPLHIDIAITTPPDNRPRWASVTTTSWMGVETLSPVIWNYDPDSGRWRFDAEQLCAPMP